MNCRRFISMSLSPGRVLWIVAAKLLMREGLRSNSGADVVEVYSGSCPRIVTAYRQDRSSVSEYPSPLESGSGHQRLNRPVCIGSASARSSDIIAGHGRLQF